MYLGKSRIRGCHLVFHGNRSEGLKCSHIHCSNPYQEMMEGEQFPEKIGRQSYEYVQERLNRLEEEMQKKNLQAEEDARRLREQTGLLSSIYDTVPCGIIRFSRSRDKGYRLISANRAALTLLGYDSVEEGLRDWHDGVLGTVLREDQERLRDCYLKLQSPGDRQDMEYRAQWKDGSIHWMDGTNMVVGTHRKGIISFSAPWWTSRPAKHFSSSWIGNRKCTVWPWRPVLPSCMNT